MPQLETRRFGTTEYEPESIFQFPSGLPGFEAEREFVFLQRPQTDPLLFLQSISNAGLCFIALPILAADPQYRLQLTPEDRADLELPPEGDLAIGKDILCAAILCAADESHPQPTANLHAPIVVNLRRRIGLQAVQMQSDYSYHHPLLTPQEVTSCS
jgi:flagellar assembly factor FliW